MSKFYNRLKDILSQAYFINIAIQYTDRVIHYTDRVIPTGFYIH